MPYGTLANVSVVITSFVGMQTGLEQILVAGRPHGIADAWDERFPSKYLFSRFLFGRVALLIVVHLLVIPAAEKIRAFHLFGPQSRSCRDGFPRQVSCSRIGASSYFPAQK